MQAKTEGAPLDEAVERRKRVLVVCELDGFANGQKPVEIERFLRCRGHDVTVANTLLLGRASEDPESRLRKLPALRPGLLPLYLVQLASRLLTRRWSFGRRHLSYYFVRAEMWLRRRILAASLALDDYDLVIGEHPNESLLMTAPTSACVVYDCATPFADELYFERRLTERQRQRLRRVETDIYRRVDRLSFHWETYASYVVTHYGADVTNLLQVNWGCTPASERARFHDPLRIIMLSSLSSHFIDLPLLSRLSKLYPIDVYGGPPPDPALGLNYLGWSPPSVLRDYQLGLITCTKDELRRDGFSAKTMAYIEYGLPVLVPAWRRHMELIRGCVPYEEDTFVSVIEQLSREDEWRTLSDAAYAQAQHYSWERVLQPLDDILHDPSHRYIPPSVQAAVAARR
jgi:hypothetical protein